ncbi:MAG: 2-oxoacid:ferredoxin oxidoreductase subunit beta [Bacteroidales bacterium]|jgi:2-oxoglutarate ferredoxin oxidoreductase subunit beta|nr:2-oxoacid:ferredoxin oxidoreductase subunit beta [Bacteroidales bacterium]
MENKIQYQPSDFKSNQEVRWCPGCGDHGFLNALHKAMAELGISRENHVVVSGIGCSSRTPYYVNTYAFHGIHGRAAAISTGVKIANPGLCVWTVTGDGDALAIGGNHFIHMIRRNMNINLILLNNQIYGLTKGQYSPTSREGQVTKTSPYGTIEPPFIPGDLVLGAQGKFFARAMDTHIKLQTEIFVEAAQFTGASVIEILQNCVIFNDGAYDLLTDKEHREDRQIFLKHGEKMIFGKEKNKGLILDGFKLKAVTIGEDGYTMDDILVHNAKTQNPFIHMMLIGMSYPEYPVAFGIIRAVETSDNYASKLERQMNDVKAKSKIHTMDELLNSGDTWTVE